MSPRGSLHLPKVKTAEAISEIEAADLVVVSVKLWDTETVAASLEPIAKRGAAIVSFQNGVQKDDLLRGYVPPDSVMGGVCYIAAAISEPGVIRHTGTMQRLVFGEYGGRPSTRSEAFLVACQKADIDAELTDAIERLIWEQFVFLVGLSGMTSKFRSPIGPIREYCEKRGMLLESMREVVTVGRAKGVPLRLDFGEDRLAFCDTLPAAMTSSMEVDLERGKRLELPWLSGTVVDLGAQFGVQRRPIRRSWQSSRPTCKDGSNVFKSLRDAGSRLAITRGDLARAGLACRTARIHPPATHAS